MLRSRRVLGGFDNAFLGASLALPAKRLRLVASDLDGTLMTHARDDDGGLVPPWLQAPSYMNQAALRELAARDIPFVPLSGRAINNMQPLLLNSGLEPGFIGGYNGGVWTRPDGDLLFTEHLSERTIRTAMTISEERGLLVKLYHRDDKDGVFCLTSCGEHAYSTEQAEFFLACGEYPYPSDHPVTCASMGERDRDVVASSPLRTHRMDSYDAGFAASLRPFKIVVLTNDPDVMIEEVAAGLPDDTDTDLVGGYFWFEFMPKGVNKSTGLGRLCEHLGFGLENCVAFGDSFNDIEMVRDAGYGVAMGNAKDEVKNVAAHTSPLTCDEDGVGREIFRLLESGCFDEDYSG